MDRSAEARRHKEGPGQAGQGTAGEDRTGLASLGEVRHHMERLVRLGLDRIGGPSPDAERHTAAWYGWREFDLAGPGAGGTNWNGMARPDSEWLAGRELA